MGNDHHRPHRVNPRKIVLCDYKKDASFDYAQEPCVSTDCDVIYDGISIQLLGWVTELVEVLDDLDW